MQNANCRAGIDLKRSDLNGRKTCGNDFSGNGRL